MKMTKDHAAAMTYAVFRSERMFLPIHIPKKVYIEITYNIQVSIRVPLHSSAPCTVMLHLRAS